MPDPQHYADSAIAPSRAPFAIVPSDTERLPAATKAIYVGTGGAVTLRGVDAGADVTYRNVPSGTRRTVRRSALIPSSRPATSRAAAQAALTHSVTHSGRPAAASAIPSTKQNAAGTLQASEKRTASGLASAGKLSVLTVLTLLTV